MQKKQNAMVQKHGKVDNIPLISVHLNVKEYRRCLYLEQMITQTIDALTMAVIAIARQVQGAMEHVQG